MMIKNFTSTGLSLALVGLLSLSACKKDNTTASADADVSFGMASDNTLVTVATTNGSGQLATFATATTPAIASVKWTDAIANISKFKLEAKKDGSSYEVSSAGLANVDLLALNPSTIKATLPKGTYTHVELKVQLVKATGTAMPLVLKGTYTTKAGTTVPIEFDFNDNLILVASLNDLTVDGKNNFVAKLNLHLNKMFGNISAQQIDNATRTNGAVLINSTTNVALYQKIIIDILTSGDGKLELKGKK
ncbi:hypothetical protein GCM10027037_33490 [Mucilaginibacter koreensis]